MARRKNITKAERQAHAVRLLLFAQDALEDYVATCRRMHGWAVPETTAAKELVQQVRDQIKAMPQGVVHKVSAQTARVVVPLRRARSIEKSDEGRPRAAHGGDDAA